MRKLILTLLLLSLLPVGMIQAQQDQVELLWTYSTINITDFQIELPYPETWAISTTNKPFFAEDVADADAEAEGGVASGVVLSFQGVALEAIGLEATATPANVLTVLTEQFGLEIQEEFPIPILSYRAIGVRAVDYNGRHQLFATWIQDQSAMLLKITAADEETIISYAADFGFIVGATLPITEVELTETYVDPTLNLTMSYPAAWIPVVEEGASSVFFELEKDVTNIASEDPYVGQSLFLIPATYETVGATPDTPLTEIADLAIANFGLEGTPLLTEHLVLDGYPAINISGPSPAWGYLDVLVIPREEDVLTLLFSYPTEEAQQAFNPARLSILKGLRPLVEPPQ